jgi:putative restriction endonuclease
MADITPRLWVLKAKGAESSFGGNKGYADDPVRTYVYDTNVKNHDKIKTGDKIVIAGKKFIIGYAVISAIDVKENVQKIRYRCPVCNTQEHYERKNVTPRYKCRKKHEFEVPIEEPISVTEFYAQYGAGFTPAEPKTSVKILDPYYRNRNIYYSIQEADIIFFNKQTNISASIDYETEKRFRRKNTEDIPEYFPRDRDTRKKRKMSVVVRPGQEKFKNELISIYGSACMITGCPVMLTLHASHICAYRGTEDDNPRNGLLLKADIHILFDADLIGINPDTLTVRLHPEISESFYKNLDGKKLLIDREDFGPSVAALKKRWESFTSFAGIKSK